MKNKILLQRIIIGSLIALIVVSLAVGGVVLHKQKVDRQKQLSYLEDVDDIDNLPEEVQQIIKTTPEKTQKEETKEEKHDKVIAKEKERIIEQVEEQTTTDEYKEYEKLPEEEKAKIDVIPRKEKVEFKELDTIKEEIGYDEETNIPSKYNALEGSKIGIENQKGYGLCWNFAGTKVLEAYLYKTKNKVYDFSEIYTDYIASNYLLGNRKLHEGGEFTEFRKTSYIKGHILEKDETEYEKDYTKDEYMAFLDKEPVVSITKTVSYPSIKKRDKDKYTNEQIEEFRKVIKFHIMKYGALDASIDPPNNSAITDMYKSKGTIMNHAITIIGWDDNYPKEKFKDENDNSPTKDGAYIAQNSYGKEWGNDGLFYVSYEDVFVESCLNGIISTDYNEETTYNLNLFSKQIQDYLYDKFRYYITEKDSENYILKEVIEKDVSTIDLSNTNLENKDLETLIYFKGLKNIDISNNNLTSIDVLSNLENIVYINASNNEIEDISSLEKNSNLRGIVLDNNKNIKGYSKIKNNTSLSLINCDIKDLESLIELEKLQYLNLDNNENINIDFSLLPPNVEELYISNTNTKSIKDLNNDKLRFLYISKNPITSIDGIENIKSIVILDISETKVQDLTPINKLDKDINNPYDNIKIIMNDSKLSDISIFNNINNLTSIELANNNIEDLSSFDNKNIKTIILSGNKIKTGLEKLSNVEALTMKDCGITNLEILNNLKNVKSLDLSKNNIKNIGNIDKNDSLYTLNLSYNDIDDVSNISKIENLSSLSLEGNNNIQGTLNSPTIIFLNLADCNLSDTIVQSISKLSNLSTLNLSNNVAVDVKGIISSIPDEKFFRLLLENITLKEEDVEYINNNHNNNLYIDDYTYEHIVNINNDTNKAEFDSNIRELLLKNENLPHNEKIIFDKFFKDATLLDSINEYEFSVAKGKKIVGTNSNPKKVVIKFKKSSEEDTETNYRKTDMLRNHKKHIRRG